MSPGRASGGKTPEAIDVDRGAVPLPIEFCCPLCRRSLERTPIAYRCRACSRTYPVLFEIPDFRVSASPGFERARDLDVARHLAEREADLDEDSLLRMLRQARPRPEDVQKMYATHLIGEEYQARAALDLLEQQRPFTAGDALLDVGCGLGRHLAVAADRLDRIVGMDISVAVLLLARKHLKGRAVLIAGEAEHLPFPDGSFAAVIAADVIEHVRDPGRLLAEIGRVLLPGAAVFLSTPNRFSLSREPHVGLWGVGFLPRSWAARWVRYRRAMEYDHVRLHSALSLRRLLWASFPGHGWLLLPRLGPRQLEQFSPLKRQIAQVYLRLRVVPIVRAILYVFGPFFHVIAVTHGMSPGGRPVE